MSAKWDRFKLRLTWLNAWSEATYVPLNFVTLSLAVVGLVAFAIKDYYGPVFWVAIGLTLWSVADIIKWRLRKLNKLG